MAAVAEVEDVVVAVVVDPEAVAFVLVMAAAAADAVVGTVAEGVEGGRDVLEVGSTGDGSTAATA